MPERRRFEYVLELEDRPIRSNPKHRQGALIRGDVGFNIETLAELMISAYHGTIDYDGESFHDAMAELDSYLHGDNVQPILDCSWLLFVDGSLASACLVGDWIDREIPLIAYVMTAGEWKKKGFSKIVLGASLECLVNDGYSQVAAVITEGNRPSEKLFHGYGFVNKLLLNRENAVSV